MEKVLYEELFPDEFQSRVQEMPVAYLPLGTMEWHGPHLPLGADGIQARELFVRLAAKMGGVVLPMLYIGPDRVFDDRGKKYYGMDINTGGTIVNYCVQQLPGSAYWIDEELFKKILMDIIAQLKRAGIKVVIGHGHGPSTRAFTELKEQALETYGVKLYTGWSFSNDEKLKFQNDHAGANETSIVMAVRPELVDFKKVKQDESNLIGIAGEHPVKRSSEEYGKEIMECTIKDMIDGLRRECPELF